MTRNEVDDFSDLKRGDLRIGTLLTAALVSAIVLASTTFYLKSLEAAASIILH